MFLIDWWFNFFNDNFVGLVRVCVSIFIGIKRYIIVVNVEFNMNFISSNFVIVVFYVGGFVNVDVGVLV